MNLENLNHWKTTLIGVIMAILGIFNGFHWLTIDQIAQFTADIPVVGSHVVDLIMTIGGWFMMFKAKDAKAPQAKKIL